MSGAPPPTIARYAIFASFEDTRLTQGSFRFLRHPITIAGVGDARFAARNRTRLSAGSFCPSPSRVTIHSPRAAHTPVRIAALCPRDHSCLTIRTGGKRVTTDCNMSPLPSTLPSSTQTISKRRSARALCTATTSGSMLSRSSRIGTTTEITLETILRLSDDNGLPYLDKPALYFRLVALSLTSLGNTEFAARLPSALFALALLVLVHRFSRREYGARAAALAVMVVAAMPLFQALARTVIFDMALAFFVCGAINRGFLRGGCRRPRAAAVVRFGRRAGSFRHSDQRARGVRAPHHSYCSPFPSSSVALS